MQPTSPPPSLQANTLANYFSRAWATLVALLFLPLYAQILGPDAYGLIGAFTILQAWALLFDFGLTPTLNREMAHFKGGVRTAQSAVDLLRSLEISAMILCGLVSAAIVISAPYLATQLLKPQTIDRPTLMLSVQIMGLVVSLRWLEQLYRAALMGLQDQVWLGKAFAVTETIRWVGAYVAIAFIEPSIVLFFLWQAIVSIVAIIIVRFRVSSNIPGAARKAHFSFAELIDIRKFAGGMFLSALLTFTLTQIDKILVAQMVPLSAFGFYMLASAAAGGLLQLITPLNQSTLPRMTEYAGGGNVDELRTIFIATSRWMAVIVMPACLLMAFFPDAVILLWTGDLSTTDSVSPILPWLALGTMVNAVMNTPYMLQLAHGWTSISNKTNIVAVAMMVPAASVIVPIYGAVGAAMLFLVLNLAYLAVIPALTFQRVLPGVTWQWLRAAALLPMGAIGTCGVILSIVTAPPTDRISAFLLLSSAGPIFLAAALWGTRGSGSPYEAMFKVISQMTKVFRKKRTNDKC